MNLTSELMSRGLTRTKLAELLKVSRKTVQRMGEDVSDEVLKVLADYVPESIVRKEPSDYTRDEVTALIKRRGGLEAETKPPKQGETSASWGKETDYEICQSVGLRVWEFNQMIADWVRRQNG